MSTTAIHASTTTDRPAAGAFSVASFVLGIASVLAGWTFVVPLVGLVLCIQGIRQEPQSKTFAIWGIVLSGIMMSIWILLGLVFLATGAAWLIALPWIH